ncbi:MAG: hypothetical protein ACU0BK_15970 [Shimia sp.]|uniref:hypothetical protein n=1 Tax=Shimia sp. TaxID=1954381 RepID=UPI004058CA0F
MGKQPENIKVPRDKIKERLEVFLPALNYAAVVTFIGFGLALLVFTAVRVVGHRGDYFLIEAETSRFEYQVTSSEQAKLFVSGVRMTSGGKDVVKKSGTGATSETGGSDDNADGHCVHGHLEPQPGAVMEFDVMNGLQRLQIRAAKDGEYLRRPTYFSRLLQLTRGFISTKPSVRKATQISEPAALAALDLAVTEYVISGTDAPVDEFLLDEAQPTGSLTFDQHVVIIEDESCRKSENPDSDARDEPSPMQTDVAFGPRGESIPIDGPGYIGRRLVVNPDGDWQPSTDLEFTSGSIEILVRETLCWPTTMLSAAGNRLSLTLFDRLFVEPALVLAVTIFVAVIGWMLSILQIEPVAPPAPRPAKGKDDGADGAKTETETPPDGTAET